MAKNRYVGDYPVIGIRPIVDGRRGPQMMRESLEPLVWAMAESAKKLFEENLFYSNGEPVKVVMADTCIGRVPETAACADKFKRNGVDITLTVTDAFKSISKTATGSSVKKVWSLLKKAGEIVGIAFGKIAELEGVFDVDFVIRARKGIIVDAEWVDLTIADGFALYNGTVANQPKCKVTGNVVTVMGVLTPKTEFTSSTTGVDMASGIPANLRPSVNLQFVCNGSSMNRWCCSVTTSGTVTISRYGTTAATTVPVGTWLPFCVTYQI